MLSGIEPEKTNWVAVVKQCNQASNHNTYKAEQTHTQLTGCRQMIAANSLSAQSNNNLATAQQSSTELAGLSGNEQTD